VLETVAALITPYVAYLLGETLGVSEVTAVIVAGLAIGAWRSKITTAQTRLQLHSVYQTVTFVLEAVVFALIGLELPTLVRDLGHAGRWPVAALAVTATLIATRVAWVFPVFAISGWRRPLHPPIRQAQGRHLPLGRQQAAPRRRLRLRRRLPPRQPMGRPQL
jgi:CPA1 family monovalent cation:H+ antiporter